jgi:hypothetical protein
VKLKRSSSSTIIPLNALEAGHVVHSQTEATPAARIARIESVAVTLRCRRCVNASTIMTITPAMPMINSGAMSGRLTSGFAT